MKIQIADKKRFFSLMFGTLMVIAVSSFLLWRYFTAPAVIAIEEISEKQKEELVNSTLGKNLELFRYLDDVKQKKGQLELTTFDEREEGSRESQFVFPEKYQDGYVFKQDGIEITMVPKVKSNSRYDREVASWAGFEDEKKKLEGEFLSYGNDDEKHLFALSRKDNTLKQWSLYNEYQSEINEEWEFKGAALKKNDDGSIEVYKLPVKKDSEATMANLDQDMATRISETLREELGAEYYFQKQNYLFSIPKPYYVNQQGERKDVEVEVASNNILKMNVKAAKDEFPVLVDPTIILAAKMNFIQINGDSAGDQLGYSVAGAGDVNGDGLDDVIVGAPYDADAGAGSGSAYIFYGGAKTTGSATSRADIKLTGDSVDDNFGYSVSGAGDVNGDGLDDVIVGALYDDDGGSNSGSAFLFYGGVTSGGATVRASVKITGDGVNYQLGKAVSGAGDMNSDGKADIIVGSPTNGSGTGWVYIFYGGVISGNATAQSSVKLTGDYNNDFFGDSVAGAGDINGDGLDDVIVGSGYAYTDDGGFHSGCAYIYYGGVISGGATDRANVKLTGDSTIDRFGVSVAEAGDVNGDGKADVIVGALEDDDGGSNSGSAFIFYGGVTSGGATARANVKLTGDAADDNFGNAVSGAGDVNGDGKADVIVGAQTNDTGGSNRGSAYVFYGGVTSGGATAKAAIKLSGDATSDYFGSSVSGAGDINGDGKDDVIVGAMLDDDGGSASGSAKIYTFNDLQNSVKLIGDAASDNFGYSVSGAGDVNGDGKDDVVVGAPQDDDGGSNSGSAFIFYGGISNGGATAKANVKLTGDEAEDRFGYSVSGAGDMNGDGLDDIIVGAHQDDASGVDNGAAFIFYGGGSSGGASAKAAVKLIGDSAFDSFGISVSDAGDVNGDGKADVIVGAHGDDDNGDFSGSAFIFYGGVSSGSATEKAGVKLTGDAANDKFGWSVSGAGDINADGKRDIIVGAYGDGDNGSESGSAFIFYGGVSSGSATSTANVKLTGDAAYDFFGISVSEAGDVNGDGKGDVIVGARGDDDGGNLSGTAFIFYGGVLSGTATVRANVKLTGDSANDQLCSVSDAGDVNGDGKDDVIVGAFADDDNGSDSGSAFIFYGGVTSGGVTARANVKLSGDSANDYFGSFVSGAGDINGDGKDDVIIGAWGDADSGLSSGSAFIFTLGPSGEMTKFDGDGADDRFGYSVAGAGDVNDDGLDDVIVGAPYDDDGGDNSGSVFIFYGGKNSGAATAQADVKLTGDNADDFFGSSVAGAGDVNGDGKDDIIVGAPQDSDTGYQSGAAYLFYGGVSSGAATTRVNVKLTGEGMYNWFGNAVDGAGDLNNDGKTDIIVGAFNDGTSSPNAGATFIFYGGVTSGSANTQVNVKITGDSSGDNLGQSVAGAGDINGDGKDDVIVGASGDDDGGSFSGSAFIFYGGVTSGGATAQANVKLTGDSANDNFGYSVAGAGDVNGDGKTDVIVGAYEDDDAGSNSGSAFVFYGGVTSGGATAQANVKLTGDSANDNFGYSVAGGEDINRDGKDDVIVGAYQDDDAASNAGAAFVFYGGVSSGAASAKVDAKLLGDATDDYFGSSVANAGDINGDGKTDIIVGTYNDDDGGSNSGSAKIITDLATEDNPDSPNFQLNGDIGGENFGLRVAGNVDINGDGKDDIIVSASEKVYVFYGGASGGAAGLHANVIIATDTVGDNFGFSVAGIKDMNLDGKDEFIASSLLDDDGGSNSGSAFIFYGGVTSGTATARANVKLTGDAASDYFGSYVADAGDMNGDGKHDVVVSARNDDDGGSNSGSVFIFYSGVTSGAATIRANVKIIGDNANDQLGWHVAGAGDMNGDGKDDVIAATEYVGTFTGVVYVFYGGVTSGGATVRANVKLTGDAENDSFGASVASAGDVNGDGKADIVVGAPYVSDGESAVGAAFIYYGGVTSGGATARANVKLTGNDIDERFGYVVDGAGDVNGDGKADIIVGTYNDGVVAPGKVLIFFGGVTSGSAFDKADVEVTDNIVDGSFPIPVCGVGDINGDGKDDVSVGALYDDDGGNDSGSVRVIYGHRISPDMPTTMTPVTGAYSYGQNVDITCSGGTYNTLQDKYGQTMTYDIEAFYSGAWHEVANDDADGNYSWNVNNVPNGAGTKLHCRTDIAGTNGGFSRWYEPFGSNLTVIQGTTTIEGRTQLEGRVRIE